ncbi:MAG TPA: Rieske 2Fe-2S domain-containing protein [Bacteroidota bacterium]|nr:Rieske 2Fe-2S domain-containing protein [Bacteroidota bacterium]
MDRKEFLSVLGLGVAAVTCSYCMGGCTTGAGGGITAPTNVDFTLDLSTAAWASLKSPGNYAYNGGLIIAHAPSGYVAVSQQCTHAGNTVIYDNSANQFFCPAHGSRYNIYGFVINGPASSPLTGYRVTINGNLLRVTS